MPKDNFFGIFFAVIILLFGCDESKRIVSRTDAKNTIVNKNGVKQMANHSAEMAVDAIVSHLNAEGNPLTKEAFRQTIRNLTMENHPNLGNYYVISSELGEFWVGMGRDKVIKYSKPPRFTVREAKKCVREYLIRHVPGFEERNYIQDRSELEEPYWIEAYTERATGKEISIFENWIYISINMDARQIQDFNASDIRLVRYVAPEINEAAAQNLIHQKYPSGDIQELNIMEYTTDGGKTHRTVWLATVLPDGRIDSPLEMLTIDADTGEIIP